MTPPNKSTSMDISKWFVILAILLGGTGGGLSGFVGQLEPAQLVMLTIAGALVGGLFSFVGRILAQVLTRHESRFVDLLDGAIQDFFSLLKPHERRYKRHLQRRYTIYNIAFNLESAPALALKDVYIELNINQDPAAINPVAANKVGDTKTDTIWWHLKWARQIAIVGAPGSGKTTLLENMNLILAGKQRYRKALKAPPRLPILIRLRDHFSRLDSTETLSLTDLISDSLTEMKGEMPPALWFERKLKAGKCLVMLDGLDEVGETRREKVIQWIQRQMSITYPECLFIVTSRPKGFLNSQLKADAVFSIQPLNNAQVKHFIESWYYQTELRRSVGEKDRRVHEIRANRGIQHLIQTLEIRPTIAELTVNPLLLSMIVSLHYYNRATLPERRTELYGQICRLFLGELDEQRGIKVEISASQKQTVLEPLAYAMLVGSDGKPQLTMSKKEVISYISAPLELLPDVNGESFLAQLKTRAPLLVEREEDEYEFAHKTFAEFLTAVHIKERGLEAELIGRIDVDDWHEVIRLYCSFPKVDANAIVKACIERQPPSTARLVLAVQCAQDTQLTPETRERLSHIVEVSLDSSDSHQRAIGANVLLRRRQLEGFRRLSETIEIDTKLVTHAEFRLFLEEMALKGQYFYPDHWDLETFKHPKGTTPIFGLSPLASQAFCDWLSARDLIWKYRLPLVTEPTLPDLCYWARSAESIKLINSIAPTQPLEITIENLLLFYWSYYESYNIDFPTGRAIKLKLDSDIVIALKLAHELGDARPLGLDDDIIRDVGLDFDIYRDLDLTPPRNIYRAFAYARAFFHAFGRLLNLFIGLYRLYNHGETVARAQGVDRALACIRERNPAFDLNLARDLALGLTRAENLTRAEALSRYEVFARDLSHLLASSDNGDGPFAALRLYVWLVGSIIDAEVNDKIVEHISSQWLKNTLGKSQDGWHLFLRTLRTATIHTSEANHREQGRFSVVNQAIMRGAFQTRQKRLEEIDVLRAQLEYWYTLCTGAKQPQEGLLLVRERKTSISES
ncbi:MAG: NACHT domain-containing protein [Pleurocapsa minor GSE-CHR-MK-17-07R]|jgi:energy-coupling factor transporter ATP-binding protein EcfA2|nr:NACHT domain-containing protein [Pleurocapsa minor GSE-CHR-MK 17-07R]